MELHTLRVTQDRRYSVHLDVLMALITYLALTGWRSRSPRGLSRDLRFDEGAILSALDGFSGLFRKSKDLYPTDIGPQHAYTLHARYARRRLRNPGHTTSRTACLPV